jgi:hypothetical protein
MIVTQKHIENYQKLTDLAYKRMVDYWGDSPFTFEVMGLDVPYIYVNVYHKGEVESDIVKSVKAHLFRLEIILKKIFKKPHYYRIYKIIELTDGE